MAFALPGCPTCGAPLDARRVLDDARESRLLDGSQRAEITGALDADGHAVLEPIDPHPGDVTTRVWVFTFSCGGCLSVVRLELGTGDPPGAALSLGVAAAASEVARLRERLVRARGDGRLEAEITGLRLSDWFRLLGIPELWREAKGVIPDEVRLVVNASWWRAMPVSPLGVLPVSLQREKFRATAHDLFPLPSGGGVVSEFKALLAGTRLRVLGIRRGELRVVPVESLPEDLGVPDLCASWDLVGKLRD